MTCNRKSNCHVLESTSSLLILDIVFQETDSEEVKGGKEAKIVVVVVVLNK